MKHKLTHLNIGISNTFIETHTQINGVQYSVLNVWFFLSTVMLTAWTILEKKNYTNIEKDYSSNHKIYQIFAIFFLENSSILTQMLIVTVSIATKKDRTTAIKIMSNI